MNGHECPVCATSMDAGALRTCPRCETPHHADCYEFAGGCAIFGCAPPDPAAPVPVVSGAAAHLQDLARRWSGIQRAQLLAGLTVGAGVLAAPFLALAAWALAGATSPLGRLLIHAAGVVPAAGVLAFCLLTIPGEVLGRRLARLSGTRLATPGQALALAHDLELTGLEATASRLARLGPRVFGWLAAVAVPLGALGVVAASLVPGQLGGPLAGKFAAAFALGMVFFLGSLVLALCDRVVASRARLVQTTQNRLVASTKKG